MHWCMDETLAVMALIPFIGIFFAKVHGWWHKHFHHKCHEPHCHDEHVEHCHMPDHIPHGKVGEEQCEQHSYTPYGHHGAEAGTFLQEVDKIFDAAQITKDDYDVISKEDLEERLGPIATNLIHKLEFELDFFLKDNQFHWFINGNGGVKATFKNRIFIFNDENWSEIK